jgi:hypothetical protein
MAKLVKGAFKLTKKAAPSLIGGVLGGSAVKSALGMDKDKPAKVAPAADPRQTVMPTADDEATQKAKRRSILEQRRRSGRMSTILTDGSDKLGG